VLAETIAAFSDRSAEAFALHLRPKSLERDGVLAARTSRGLPTACPSRQCRSRSPAAVPAVRRIVHGAGGMMKASPAWTVLSGSRDLEDDGSLQHVTDLFARVRVAPGRRAWLKLADRRDHFTTRRGNVRLLENGPFESGLLCVHPRRKANDGDSQRDD
jgi:hypothetical protein